MNEQDTHTLLLHVAIEILLGSEAIEEILGLDLLGLFLLLHHLHVYYNVEIINGYQYIGLIIKLKWNQRRGLGGKFLIVNQSRAVPRIRIRD